MSAEDERDDLAWDMFVSHASEDKGPFVRPLVRELSRLGLRVWYDEFTLRLGDSLSASIDRGLADSRFGLVVISKHFIVKPWPQRELAGLVAGEMGQAQVILPVWLDVSEREVFKFSPPLADKLAVNATGMPITDVALRILERVKPALLQAYHRRLEFERLVAAAETEYVDPRTLQQGPIQHETLPHDYYQRIRLIREALLDVFDVSWTTTVDNFRRDITPTSEIEIWEKIAGIYLTVVNEFALTGRERHDAYRLIVTTVAFGQPDTTLSGPWVERTRQLCENQLDPLKPEFGSISLPQRS